MPRRVLQGVVGLWAMAGLVSGPAAAGDCCDCGYVVRGYSAYEPAPRAYGYYYEPRVLYRRFHPRWQYSAAYYNSPRAYGRERMAMSPGARRSLSAPIGAGIAGRFFDQR